jgi:hypothetical protein
LDHSDPLLISRLTFQECPDDSLGSASDIFKVWRVFVVKPQEEGEISVSGFNPKRRTKYKAVCIRVEVLSQK